MAVISGNPLVLLAGIGLLAAVAQWSAWRLKLPAILPLLVFGIVVGPVTGVLDPDALFGDLLFPIVSLSVAVILFEGALTLKISELREIGTTVRNLVTIGALITWLVTSVTVHLSLGFDFDLAMLFGAMVVVTGPTVIVPMLRTVRPVRRVANILRWEGIVIDPIGALLAVLAFNYVLASQKTEALDDIFALFLMVVAIGSVIGLIFGFGLALILRKDWLPEYLRSPFTLLMVFVAFAGAEMAEHESGLLAVTIFGMVLANRPGVEVHDILDFKESLSVLLISGLFILLAARVDFEGLVAIGWPAALVVAVIILVARPLAVFVSTIGSELSINERLLIAWIGPRGIVCAAVAAIFALRLEQVGAEGASLLVPLAFSVIITTVVLQSLTARRLAGLLGVRDPAPAGYLIIGSGQVARMIAKSLAEHDVRVVIADSDWDQVSQARMEGIETYYGNPISDHADRYLDLSGIGNVICLSGRSHLDALTGLHFRSEFGSGHVYELPTSAEGRQQDKHRVSGRHRGKHLFGEDVTHNRVLGLLHGGWTTKTTGLTEEFGLAEYMEKYQDKVMILFALDSSARLRLVTDQENWQPEAGWQIISLVGVQESENEQ
ncbi:MAG: sodium:proton antiporter [Gammaproteobacteria bacterium]|nr:sodium:proton antiporter [Gammaproteobacteria bacterium]